MKRNRYLVFIVAILAQVPQAHADKDYYRYKLEDGAEHDVCRHMTKVFNTRFRTPWDKGWLRLESVPKINGIRYDQVFERMPGVEYDKGFVFDMLLSKYPTSPEFEAVKWVETRGYVDGYDSRTLKKLTKPFPVLITKLDIDNDGQPDWVVKGNFMRMPSRDDDLNFGGHDGLVLFREDAFDPATAVIESQTVPWYINASSAFNDATYHQLRPFIYQQTTYVAGYRAIWEDRPDRRTDRHSVLPIQLFPDEEYMNVLRVLPGGGETLGPYSSVLATKTEVVCRIRMIMQKKPIKRGGR